MGLHELLYISSTAPHMLIHFFLSLILHAGQLLDACQPGCDNILYFGCLLRLLMQLDMICNAFRAQGFDAVRSLADIGDGIFVMGWTGNGDEAWGASMVD